MRTHQQTSSYFIIFHLLTRGTGVSLLMAGVKNWTWEVFHGFECYIPKSPHIIRGKTPIESRVSECYILRSPHFSMVQIPLNPPFFGMWNPHMFFAKARLRDSQAVWGGSENHRNLMGLGFTYCDLIRWNGISTGKKLGYQICDYMGYPIWYSSLLS